MSVCPSVTSKIMLLGAKNFGVAPLLDAEGRTAFFLGGQINCSTTIHSCSDILRLLSMSEDPEAVDDPHLATAASKTASSGLHGFFKAFLNRNNDKYFDSREAGMEHSLINQIERKEFREQMEMFYTAYSKVCLQGRTIPIPLQ